MSEAREIDATAIRPGGTVPVSGTGPTPFTLGQKLNDRYTLIESIGAGGFGYVFRARDELLGRDVALKTLSTRRLAEDEDQLLEEARTIAKLDHPHIVPIYDVGVTGGVTWMAMKLIDGQGLERILATQGRLDGARAVSIAEQAALALDHAHRRGIIHRDVKPSNILVSKRDDGAEHVWLADFGIAKILTGKTTTGESLIAGTPSYMAPEQITGKRVDARTDIFALGCITAEMVTGRRCFPGDTFSELTYKIVHEPPEGVSDIAGAAGPALEATIRRALAKSPEDRFQTAEEFRRQLLQPSAVPRVSLLKRLRRRGATAAWDGRDVIACNDVWKGYGWRTKVVRGVDLNVPRGAIYALLGRNGTGKTTLIRTILGLYRRDKGVVRLFGRDPEREPQAILPRVGFVPESLPVYDTLRVGELLHLMSQIYSDWDHAFAYQLLGKFRLPMEKKIGTLSRGMKTQLGLVSALAHRPELLLLDDPTLGLDAVVLDDFFATLAETSRKEGTTVLMASHNIAELESIASHVGLFADGRIVLADSLEGLRTRTREVTVTFADDAPRAVSEIADFKTIRASGRHVTGFVMDESSGAIDELKALKPTSIDTRELTLKEIFVNFMRES
jgi:ABC-type multidrug transport system ATPase subunit